MLWGLLAWRPYYPSSPREKVQGADKPESKCQSKLVSHEPPLVTVTEANRAGKRAGTGLGGAPWLSHLLCDFETRNFTSVSLHFPCGE